MSTGTQQNKAPQKDRFYVGCWEPHMPLSLMQGVDGRYCERAQIYRLGPIGARLVEDIAQSIHRGDRELSPSPRTEKLWKICREALCSALVQMRKEIEEIKPQIVRSPIVDRISMALAMGKEELQENFQEIIKAQENPDRSSSREEVCIIFIRIFSELSPGDALAQIRPRISPPMNDVAISLWRSHGKAVDDLTVRDMALARRGDWRRAVVKRAIYIAKGILSQFKMETDCPVRTQGKQERQTLRIEFDPLSPARSWKPSDMKNLAATAATKPIARLFVPIRDGSQNSGNSLVYEYLIDCDKNSGV